MSQILVIGNWKMNGSLDSNRRLLLDLLPNLPAGRQLQVAVCPSYPYLAQVSGLLWGTNVRLGAQDLNASAQGAFTGEVSGPMLRDLGCHYVLVGHSERRTLYGETDEVVADKFEAAVSNGLTPVLCVGETLEERREERTMDIITRQLQSVLAKVGPAALAKGVIAYEPVWAIGTGESATPEQAQEVHAHIRGWLFEHLPTISARLPLLYGGSVNAGNAEALFGQADIDGGLVGGASLDSGAFAAICQSAHKSLMAATA